MESGRDKPGEIFFKEFQEFRLIKQLSFHGYLDSYFDTLPCCTCKLVKLVYPVVKIHSCVCKKQINNIVQKLASVRNYAAFCINNILEEVQTCQHGNMQYDLITTAKKVCVQPILSEDGKLTVSTQNITCLVCM